MSVVQSCSLEDAVNGHSTDVVFACQRGDADFILRISAPNGLAVMCGKAGILVDVHTALSFKYCKQR